MARRVEVKTCRWACDSGRCSGDYMDCKLLTEWREADVLEGPVLGDDTYWVDVWSDAEGKKVARFIPTECVREMEIE